MSTIGQTVVTINGQRVRAQGIAPLKDGVTSDDAATKAKTAGTDEMIISYNDKDGNKQRLLVWGDKLDFSFRNKQSIPDVKVNGSRAMMVAYDNEPNTMLEGAWAGMVQGLKDTCDAISTMAKASIQGVAVTSGAALLGSTVWVTATGGNAAQFIMGAVKTMGPGLATAAGAISLVAVGLVLATGMIRGAINSIGLEPKTEVFAGIIDDKVPLPPAAPTAAPVVPPAPAAPTAPTANSPAANSPAANKVASPAANKVVSPAANKVAAPAPAAPVVAPVAPSANTPAAVTTPAAPTANMLPRLNLPRPAARPAANAAPAVTAPAAPAITLGSLLSGGN